MSPYRFDALSRPTLLATGSVGVFVGVLVFSTLVAVSIQMVFLPFVVPHVHAGHGLLQGADWVYFHTEAVKLADKIALEGWQAFELRPNGQAPIGIAAIAYSLTGISEPWVLIPLHATLFALSALALFNLYRCAFDTALSVAGIAPWVLFPSSAILYGQIHKDVWSIAGSIWLFFVLSQYLTIPQLSWKRQIALLGITIVATMSIWLVRAYLLQVVLAGVLIAVGLFFIWSVVTRWLRPLRNEVPRWTGLSLCILIVVAVSFDWPSKLVMTLRPELQKVLTPVNVLEDERALRPEAILPQPLLDTLTQRQVDAWGTGEFAALKETFTPEQQGLWENRSELSRVFGWLKPDGSKVSWLPLAFQQRLDTVIHIRRGSVLTGLLAAAGSVIDHDVPMTNSMQILTYLPRASQIALFAPFPDMWFGAGASPGGGVMRWVAGIETMLAYFLFAGFLPLIILTTPAQRKLIVFVCLLVLPILCIFAVTLPIVGTLYRMRLGYLHMLLGFGVMGWALAARPWIDAGVSLLSGASLDLQDHPGRGAKSK